MEFADEVLTTIIHDLVRIASVLKSVESGNLTDGQKQIIHGCETRLHEIREMILQATGTEEKKNGLE